MECAYFAMEYAPGGELGHILDMHNNAMTAPVAKFYMIEIFAALSHVHSIGYVYRDVKLENIVIDEEGHVKLVDFGSAIRRDYYKSGKFYTLCCHVDYLSPEQLNGNFSGGYTCIVDWWAMGVLMFELMTGSSPFNKEGQNSEYEVLLRILKNSISFPSKFDPSSKDLIQRLLHSNLKLRLCDPQEIRRHAYFDDVKDWERVEDRKLVPPFVPDVPKEGDCHHFILSEERSSKQLKKYKGAGHALKMF